MLMLQFPAMVLVLIPVIVIEAIYLQKTVIPEKGLAWRTSAFANLFSSFIGVPLTWLLLLGLEWGMAIAVSSIHLESPSLPKVWQHILFPFFTPMYSGASEYMAWNLPIVNGILFVPYYYASVYSESWIASRMASGLRFQDIVRANKRAHLITYSIMFIAACVVPWYLYGPKK